MSQKAKRRGSTRSTESRSSRRHSDPSERSTGSNTSKCHRSKSMPNTNMSSEGWPHVIKGIMKFKSLDESLHSTYRSVSYLDEAGSDSSKGKQPNRIKFTNIEVREYARTVGDNPSCSSGPPVSISWEYNPETMVLAIEEYENTRPTRRTMSQMVLPRSVRTDILRKEWGISQSQIASAVRSGVRAKNQRRTTLGNLGKTDKVEEMIEGATKKLLKTLFLRRSSSQGALELDEKVREIQRQNSQQLLVQTMSGEYSDSDDAAPRKPVRQGSQTSCTSSPPQQPQRRSDVIVAYEPQDELELSDDCTEQSEPIHGDYSPEDMEAAAKLLVAQKQESEKMKQQPTSESPNSSFTSLPPQSKRNPTTTQAPELTPQPPDDEEGLPPIQESPKHHDIMSDLSHETTVEC